MRWVTLLLLAACGPSSGSTLATASDSPSALFGAGTTAYFTTSNLDDPSRCVLASVSVTGGAARTLASGLRFPGATLIGDDTSLYYDTSDPTGSAVWAVPLAGGTPRQLYAGQPGELGHARDLASDGSNVYFTTWGGDPGRPGALHRVAGAGGNPVKIAEGHFTEVAIFGATLAVLEPNVRIATATLPGSTLTTLFPLTGSASQVAVDASFVYWSNGSAHRVPIAGGSAQDLLGGGGAALAQVAADYRGAVLSFSSTRTGNDGPGASELPGGIYSVDSGGFLTQLARADGPAPLALSPAVVLWFDGMALKGISR